MYRLRQPATQPQTERQANRAEQKGDAPAIGFERSAVHQLRKHEADQRAGGGGDLLAHRLPRNREPSPAGRRRFHQIGRGRPDLAAERKPLNHARDDRDDRRGDADGLIGGRQRQYDDGRPHHHEAQDHRRPPARAVGVGPDHQSANRPGNEAGAKRRQRQHQAGKSAVGGEKCAANLNGEKAVGNEVVELEHIADGDGKRAATDQTASTINSRRIRLVRLLPQHLLCHLSHLLDRCLPSARHPKRRLGHNCGTNPPFHQSSNAAQKSRQNGLAQRPDGTSTARAIFAMSQRAILLGLKSRRACSRTDSQPPAPPREQPEI